MTEYLINGAAVAAKFFTKEQKTDHKLVEKVGRFYAEYTAAQAKWAQFLKEFIAPIFIGRINTANLAEFDTTKGPTGGVTMGHGVTINNIPKDRRVIVKQNSYIKMNEFAKQAKTIIDELLKQTREEMPADVADLFQLLKSMFLEKKHMVYTPGIAAFVAMQNIRSRRLLDAQELLRKAMDAEMGRVYCYVERKDNLGKWEVER